MIPPDSTAQWTIPVQVSGSTVPWWLGQRVLNIYEPFVSALDGVARPAATPDRVTIPAVGIPENIRRVSDVTVLVRIAGQLIGMSVGPIVHRTADPLGGVQERVVTGVPPDHARLRPQPRVGTRRQAGRQAPAVLAAIERRQHANRVAEPCCAAGTARGLAAENDHARAAPGNGTAAPRSRHVDSRSLSVRARTGATRTVLNSTAGCARSDTRISGPSS